MIWRDPGYLVEEDVWRRRDLRRRNDVHRLRFCRAGFLSGERFNGGRFEEAGSEMHGRTPYWSVPETVLADQHHLEDWAQQALEAPGGPDERQLAIGPLRRSVADPATLSVRAEARTSPP